MTPSWRDLADLLTPEQCAEIDHVEREQIWPCEPRHLVNAARNYSAHNLIQQLCADIAPPGDALDVEPWEDWGDGYARPFTAFIRLAGATTVEVSGFQHDDGRAERDVLLRDAPEALTAMEARALAAVLVEAAGVLSE